MGNRAVIEFKGQGIGVYLHWNGGRDSVEAFLKAAKDLECRSCSYGAARLCQIIGNWFGGTISIGVGRLDSLDQDNGDNGKYIVENWEIVGREYNHCAEQIDPGTTQEIYASVMRINQPIFDPEILASKT